MPCQVVLSDPHFLGMPQKYPVQGTLHLYDIAGKDAYYLELTAMPDRLMGKRSDVTIHADMIHGKPLIAVSPKWLEDGTCGMELEAGTYTRGWEIIADYRLLATVDVGPVEYTLAENERNPSFFATWERTPGNDRNGHKNFYWGHYFDSRESAIRDFCSRAGEKFKALSSQQRPSVRAQLAEKQAVSKTVLTKSKEREAR